MLFTYQIRYENGTVKESQCYESNITEAIDSHFDYSEFFSETPSIIGFSYQPKNQKSND